MAKLPSSITDLAAFYFLSCATRIKSLRPRLNGIFILRCKVIQCKFPPVKKAKVTTNATGKVSTKAGQSLESSDRWLAKISIGNQARNAEVNLTMKQETRLKTSEAMTSVVLKWCDSALDANTKATWGRIVKCYEKELKEFDNQTLNLQHLVSKLQQEEKEILGGPVNVANTEHKNDEIILAESDSSCTINTLAVMTTVMYTAAIFIPPLTPSRLVLLFWTPVTLMGLMMMTTMTMVVVVEVNQDMCPFRYLTMYGQYILNRNGGSDAIRAHNTYLLNIYYSLFFFFFTFFLGTRRTKPFSRTRNTIWRRMLEKPGTL